jgi:hypothetical protein
VSFTFRCALIFVDTCCTHFTFRSHFNFSIDVPVLPIPTSPFIEVVEPPTLEELRDLFQAHPQGHERAHAHIKMGAFSPLHRLLAKIVLHNFWPTVHRSELILKRV